STSLVITGSPTTWWKKYTTFSGRDSIREIAVDDNTVKTMVNKHHQFPKEADKSFHGSSSASFLLGEQDDQIDGPWKSTQKNFKYLWLAFTKGGRPVEIARFYALLQATLIWRFEVFKIAWIKNCGDRSSFTSSLPISLPLDVSLPKASAPYRACRYDLYPSGPTHP